jgi:hypothetical protein
MPSDHGARVTMLKNGNRKIIAVNSPLELLWKLTDRGFLSWPRIEDYRHTLMDRDVVPIKGCRSTDDFGASICFEGIKLHKGFRTAQPRRRSSKSRTYLATLAEV